MPNNNNAYNIVRSAYEQVVGSSAVETLNLTDIVDVGTTSNLFTNSREQFTKALIEQCARTYFTDESYRNEYKDPFFVDSRRFASVTQLVSATAPQVQESHAWRTFVSGTSTAGQYTLFLPVVESKLYAKSISYELPIAITDEQWNDAVRSAEELESLIDYILLVIDNAMIQHRADMNAANRNNFIAEKIQYSNSNGALGIHKINLLAEYNTQRGGNLSNVSDFLSSAEALRFGEKLIETYAEYLRHQSTLFNTEQAVKFVPASRLVLQLNTAFLKAYEEVALSTTFNERFVDFVNADNYESVPCWQGFGVNDDDVKACDFSEVSKISVTTASGDVTQSGIVGFLADKWAIMHTIRSERVAVTRFDPEAVTQYYYQARDSYMNNLGLPAVVFTIEPVNE